MKLLSISVICLIVSCLLIITVPVFAHPSETFSEEDGHVFDEWDICRTRSQGEDGFLQITEVGWRPVIVLESLDKNADRAYELGKIIAQNYPDIHQRAEKIFLYARDRVRYKPDIDEFGFEEYAQNADEVAATIDTKGYAYGDCEDYAMLLAVMYKGAGYRSAIAVVVGPDSGHVATLIHLPEYKKANIILEFEGESGWVWAEATGGNNPFGWMPEDLTDVAGYAYEVKEEPVSLSEYSGISPLTSSQSRGKGGISIAPFFGVIVFMLLIPILRRRHR